MANNSRVACIQMTSNDDVNENLSMAAELIQQAVRQGAHWIVLPEMFAMIGLDQAAKVKHKENIGQGPIQDFLSQQAKMHHLWIVGGTIPIVSSAHDNKVCASCLVFDHSGERVARYDKIHLFDVELPGTQEIHSESKTIAPGEQIVVVSTPFGKVGLAVCYDVRFPEMFRHMLKQDVEVIALPAAFTYTTGTAHWDILIRARAIENLAFVVAAGQTGVHKNKRKTYGHSMIVNPWGIIQACLPEQPGVIVSEINLDFLKQIRQDFPALTHRKNI